MTETIDSLMWMMRPYFRRVEAFEWYTTTVLGKMIQRDSKGVTSIMRAYGIDESRYGALLHFYYSKAWNTEDVEDRWANFLVNHDLAVEVNGRNVLIGDHTKVAKSGRSMPGVKKHYDSGDENSGGKGSYMIGHFWAFAGVLLGMDDHVAALPAMTAIQDGLKAVGDWEHGEKYKMCEQTNILQMLWTLYTVTQLGDKDAYAVLDRAFMCGDLVDYLDYLNNNADPSDPKLDLIVRLKNNSVAWEPPVLTLGQRGRPRKYGEKVNLYSLFDDPAQVFTPATINAHGTSHEVEYLCMDLLYHKEKQRLVRFVLVRSERGNAIFASTDVTLAPEDIILLYILRWKVEVMFRHLKSDGDIFNYHFWIKGLKLLEKYAKADDPDPLSKVDDPKVRERILETLEAYHRSVILGNIAYGILTLLGMDPDSAALVRKYIYQRKRSHPKYASPGEVRRFCQGGIFLILILASSERMRTLIMRRAAAGDGTGGLADLLCGYLQTA